MAKKVGKCINIDCDNYKQEVEVAAGEEFECPLCHQHLEEVAGGKSNGGKNNKKKIIIAVVAVVLLGGGTGLWFRLHDDDKAKNAPKIEDPAPVLDPNGKSKDSVNVAKSDSTGTKKPRVKEPKKDPVKKPPHKFHGTVNLGYGIYTGDLKNGQPHGYGTITYTQSHKIVNSKDFVASPGDTFEGDFREGRISSLGYWIHDGNKTGIRP